MRTINLYNADCFDIFVKLDDNCVDLVVCDPPFGITDCEWDIMLDHDRMWKELKRICRPKAYIILFCTTKFGYELIKSNYKDFKYDLVWAKSMKVGFLNSNKQPLRGHEMIYVFVNEKRGEGSRVYNKIGTELNEEFKLIQRRKLNKAETEEEREEIMNAESFSYKDKVPSRRGVYGIRDLKYKFRTVCKYKVPHSVLKYSNGNNNSMHPTQKPTDMLDWLVQSYSNEWDTVLDFTMGSGSTGVSCVNNNRNFIGIELEKDYFEISKKRILSFLEE